MSGLEQNHGLVAAICVKWTMCQTPKDWRDMQHWLDGCWSTLASIGAGEAAEDVTALVDLAFEREFLKETP